MQQLPAMVAAVVWPFCRFLAAFAAAPILGEAMVPMRVRAMAALALAVTSQPGLPPAPQVDPMSVAGMALMAEQVMVGGLLGFSFHLVLSGLMVLGTLISSQMGLSIAMLNDPGSDVSSDAMSSLLYALFILLFLSMDGHLLLTQVLARSFRIWPVGGGGMDASSLEHFAYAAGWIFAVAIMMALPVVFAIMVVQMGVGFMQRVAPALNVFALGYAVYTLFGLLLVLLLLPSIPGHFIRMMTHTLDLLDSMALRKGAI